MKQTVSDRRATYLDVLRAIAIVLVTNSHSDSLYPIRQLGTGGMFGNELFFFVSGFALLLGLDASREAFLPWLKRRVLRIYEPLVIAAAFFVLVGYLSVASFSDFFWLFIVSERFWFLPTIMAFYVPIYLIIRSGSTRRTFAICFSILAIAYVLIFVIFAEKTQWITEIVNVQPEVTWPLREIYYFSTMLMGVYAARFHRDIVPSRFDFVGLGLSVLGYYAFVGLLGRGIPFELQILDRVPAVAFLIFAYRIVRRPTVTDAIMNHVGGLIMLLSGLTLQIYLVHEYVLSRETIGLLPFPANLFVFAVGTLSLAVLLQKISFTPLQPRRSDGVSAGGSAPDVSSRARGNVERKLEDAQ